MFIPREALASRSPQYIISYAALTDVGDRSVLVDNLRAIAAGEVDVEPTIYASISGRTEFEEVECRAHIIDAKNGKVHTVVKTLHGDVIDNVVWHREDSGPKTVKRAKRKKKARKFYLLAEVFPLPRGARSFKPIGVFPKLRRAKEWAQDLTRDYELAGVDDGDFVLFHEWVPDSSGELTLHTRRERDAEIGIVQFVIVPIPVNPARRNTRPELLATAVDAARARGDEETAKACEDELALEHEASRL